MRRRMIGGVLAVAGSVVLSGCGFSPYQLPLPGGADLGDDPYSVTIAFRDVLDLVPQSAVRVDDIAVGKVTDIELDGWTARVTVAINRDAELPDNAIATIRQTSLLGEKFVSLAPPETGGSGALGDGDEIPLDRSGRNPEIEEVLGAASLLFNGGGLEKTNTIVRELNDALGGNEPEIRELVSTTSEFIGQLDQNKQALLTSLEKVNRLSIAANEQTDAITGALDELPAALKVVNDQRDELVGLLQSLDRLGDVATGVIRDSKADTVADLKALVPTLTNLTRAGDDLATSTQALLTFPFSDGFVGGSVASATGRCEDRPDGQDDVKEGACFGDFANLSVKLDLGVDQLTDILGGFDLTDLVPAPAGAGATPGTPDVPDQLPAPQAVPGTDGLRDLINDLMPGGSSELPGLGQTTPGGGTGGSSRNRQPAPAATTGAPAPAPTTGSPSGGFLCSLLGSCRAPVAAVGPAALQALLIEPAVAP